ncbi:MAG TPA: hypothetical protein VKC53_00670 [Patescibacteria group bacterium]|nr:hypothetical protein [Patescibacteria group bacterium]
MNKEQKENSQVEASTRLAYKIEKAMIVIGMAGGASLMTGVILQTFLEIPTTEVPTYLVTMIPAAIVGAGIGVYLNRFDNQDLGK